MAKRFTDSNKWEDPWFRKLPIEYRLLWIFILDRCDVAGVWKVDLELAGHLICGKFDSYDRQKCLDILNGRVHVLGNGDGERWFIVGFIKFQYGNLISSSRPHMSVIKLLKEHGLLDRVSDRVFHTLKDKDKDKEQEKDKDTLSILFEELWLKYPSKVGKDRAYHGFCRTVKTDKDKSDIRKALEHYLQSDRVRSGFVQNGKTWFNDWSGWVHMAPKPVSVLDKYEVKSGRR